MIADRLPDGTQITPWSGGKGRFMPDAFWELTDLQRWGNDLEVLTILRRVLAEDLVSPNLTLWSDDQVLALVARALESGHLIRHREGVVERVAGKGGGEKDEAPPPPVKKPEPPKAPAPAPPSAPEEPASYSPQAEGMRQAAEEGAPFYCDCEACRQAASGAA